VASTDLDAAGLANRIEELLDGIAETGGPQVAHAAEELVRVLMRFYGAGLEQVVSVIRAGGGDAMVHRLSADPLVAGLLALHDLHPVELATRLRYALDTARRRLGSHGVGIELTGVDGDGMVRVRIPGGCGVDTVRDVVEAAVAEAAPDTAGVVFDRAAAEPPLLQIGVRPPAEVVR
jgi:Fe-S cluster biogenesis protein NfuA